MSPSFHLTLSWLALVLLSTCEQGDTSNPGDNSPSEVSADADAVVGAPFRYLDMCEASAAVALDDQHFAVASDDSETLAIYKRGEAKPRSTFTHSEVTDLEGAARLGDTIFWLTSHSLAKPKGGERVGKDKPKRKVLFATRIGPGPVLVEAGNAFTGLRPLVATALGMDETTIAPWLNIEGTASAPGSDLLLGLRGAPAGEKRAYVVRIGDPFSLTGLPPAPAAATHPPDTRRVWQLDLGGRGIRSLERIGEGSKAYLILAGPMGEQRMPFALFWWDGVGEKVMPGPIVSFGDMAPEALFAWPDGEIQILGDNEGGETQADKCSEKKEDKRPRWFPSLSLRPTKS
jgi:hypothetical protein